MNLANIQLDNIRITKQRKLILDELRNVHTHPTAKELHKLVLKKNPKIGLATIYRTLDFLEENDLVIKINSNNKEARYDGQIEKHCHLICSSCGKIFDIFDSNLIIKSKELSELEFKPKLEYLEIRGLCKECSSR